MKRVLVKLSGETLANKTGDIYDFSFVDRVASVLKEASDLGFEIAVVVGAGNIFRGRQGGDMDRTDADRMGMLATVINAICLKDAVRRAGKDALVMTSVGMAPLADLFEAGRAKEALAAGKVVILGGGTGLPFFSTDTAAAVRAVEIGADAILMAKNVDFIYDDDPAKNPNAHKYETVSETEILVKNLRAIDATAAAFCREQKMPIRVFGLSKPEDILTALTGACPGTVVIPE